MSKQFCRYALLGRPHMREKKESKIKNSKFKRLKKATNIKQQTVSIDIGNRLQTSSKYKK